MLWLEVGSKLSTKYKRTQKSGGNLIYESYKIFEEDKYFDIKYEINDYIDPDHF